MTALTGLDGSTLDAISLVSFLAAALIPFGTYVVLWLLGMQRLPAAKDTGAGRRLLGPLFVGFYYWLLGPALRLAKRTGLEPNHLTLASLAASIPTGICIATGHLTLAAVLLIAGNFATSYVRARGKALGGSGAEGLIQRADRLVILSVALAVAPYFGHLTEGRGSYHIHRMRSPRPRSGYSRPLLPSVNPGTKAAHKATAAIDASIRR